MKRLLSLLLLCLFLAGCEGQTQTTVPTTQPDTQPPQSLPTEPPRELYDPSHPLEGRTEGAVRVYPLEPGEGTDLYALGEDLLLLSGEKTTTLTVLTGNTRIPAAEKTLDFSLSEGENTLQVWEEGLAYFDPLKKQTVLLDKNLRELRTIAAPPDLAGTPRLSADGGTLYYCTGNALRAWDLETGIRRLVKEMTFPEQRLSGLYREDTVLRCQVADSGIRRTLLLDASTGALLWEGAEDLNLHWTEGGWTAVFREGGYPKVCFSGAGDAPMALIPQNLAAQPRLLEDMDAVVTMERTAEGFLFDCYDLFSGRRVSRLMLEGENSRAMKAVGEEIWILLDDALYRWTVGEGNALDPADETCYTVPVTDRDVPDEGGMEDCVARSAELGEKYGVQILIGEEAAAISPWDYEFTPEFSLPVLRHQLELLDKCLSHYPEGVLEDTKAHFTALKLCLVRRIAGTTASGAPASVNGLQFLDGTDAYVVLASGQMLEQALYHELFHVMETHILGGSTALDQWNDLNPEGFAYDLDYALSASRDEEQYLTGEARYFVDTYSMSFPKEDRARIMEYAMLPGNRELFRGRNMQRKLEALCSGIRRSYGLRKSPESFLWEQYLECPMAYVE